MEQTTTPFFKKILVIDDNAVDRYIAKRIIEKFLFAQEIVLQESAREALKYLTSLESFPDLLPQFIFLDINMPGMNGHEFLEEYTKISETIKRNCVIIIMTSSSHTDDLKRSDNNPLVAHFLNKPLDKEKLEIIKQEFLLQNNIFKAIPDADGQ
jgi:CheY-like chemotaxis protein